MMDKRTNMWLVISGVLLVILGICCVCFSGAALATMAVIAGIGFVLAAVTDLATFSSFGGLMIFSGWLMFYAVFDILMALLCFFNPLIVGASLVWLGAIFVICVGVAQLFSALQAKKAGLENWWEFLASGLAAIIFGILLICYPRLFMVFVGIVMIIHGGLVVYAGAEFKRLLK